MGIRAGFLLFFQRETLGKKSENHFPSRYRAKHQKTPYTAIDHEPKGGKRPNLVEFLVPHGILQCKLLVLFVADS